MVSADIDAPFVAAIGNFDGVHRGHQFLIDETIAFARELQARPAVVVFDPHPRRYFRPDVPPFLLTTAALRDELLRTHGIVGVISVAFNRRLAALSPQEFVRDVLKNEHQLAGVVTGADFRFGADRAGDGEALQRLGRDCGMSVKLVGLFGDNAHTEKFGSSAVREALRKGQVKAAAQMLGRPWVVRGVVVQGQELGRTLGFATANILLGDLVEPRKGVYAVRVKFAGGDYLGVANFGRRPTVGAAAALLEVNLFDFDGDLYGAELDVGFIDFIRDEQKFDGLDELKAQIGKDCEAAKERLR